MNGDKVLTGEFELVTEGRKVVEVKAQLTDPEFPHADTINLTPDDIRAISVNPGQTLYSRPEDVETIRNIQAAINDAESSSESSRPDQSSTAEMSLAMG
ncbi:MAG: hypothetical protein AAF204_05565 [Pseudomonadota bacterium]